MAAVPIEIRGTLYDLQTKSSREVFLQGSAALSGVGVGGGPVIPPGSPPGIWGGPIDPYPDHGLPGRPPGTWGGAGEPFPTPPIYIPPSVPPSLKPPEAPEPGSPTTAVPGNWPVQPVTPPEYVVFNYPGIGPVVVAPPASAEPK